MSRYDVSQKTDNVGQKYTASDINQLRAMFTTGARAASTFSVTDADALGVYFFSDYTQLPWAPSSGVITIPDGVTLFPVCNIDLAGNRIESSGLLAVTGANAETTYITSTGLAAGESLISSTGILNLRTVTLNPPADCYGVDIDGIGNPLAVADWDGVNFKGGKSAKLKDLGNVVLMNIGVLDNQNGIEVSGTIGTFATTDSFYNLSGAGKKAIAFASDCVITRRIRLTDTAIVVSSSAAGIDVPETITIPDDSYIADTVNFSGGGTYLLGINPADLDSLKHRFSECRGDGITNTSRVGGYYAEDNASATTITVQGTYYKLAGSTSVIDVNSGFQISGNRATYIAAISKIFHIDFSVTFVSGNNNVCSFKPNKYTLATNTSSLLSPKLKSTANGSGRSENISGSGAARFSYGDYIELWGTNETGANPITAENFSMTLTEA
jgi:hypothetical protein